MKVVLAAVTLLALLSYQTTEGITDNQIKQFNMLLEWFLSGNSRMEKQAFSLIIRQLTQGSMKNWDKAREKFLPFLNAALPILKYPYFINVTAYIVPKYMKYNRPNVLRLLKDPLFHDAVFGMLDEFNAATQNKTGFNESDPLHDLKIIFERVNWKTIYNKMKPYVTERLKKSSILDNDLIMSIVGDFVPKHYIETAKAVMSKVKPLVSYIREDEINDDLIHSFNNYTGASHNNLTQCQKDLLFTLKGTLRWENWAKEMLDAHGKLGPGIKRGRLHALGSYEECHDIRAYQNVSLDSNNPTDMYGINSTNYEEQFELIERFKGHYCRVTWKITDELLSKITPKKSPMPLTLAWGVCLPDTCMSVDVEDLIPKEMFAKFGMPLHDVYCGEKPNFKEDVPAIIAIMVIICIIVFITVGTCFDLCRMCHEDGLFGPDDDEILSRPRESGDDYELKNLPNYDDSLSPIFKNGMKTKPVQGPIDDEYIVLRAGDFTKSEDDVSCCMTLMGSASFITNIKRLISRRTTSGTIHCMHGIRVFSMSWIILISTYYFSIFSEIGIPLTENLLDAKKLMQRFVVQLITSGPLAIDTFFLMGGTLASFWMLKRMEHDKAIKASRLLQYVGHRFIRIVPLYMIMLLAFAALYQYNGHGPLWFKEQPAAEHCKTNWWTNILFINNIVHNEHICMPWSWYLSTDMQFYLLSLGFIILIFKKALAGLAATVILGLIGIICTAILENMGAGGLMAPPTNPDMNYKQDIWMAPWCRITPYAIGLILGFILHKTNRKPLFNKLFYVLGWVITIFIGLLIVFVPYTEMGVGRSRWTQSSRTAFESLHHPIWACCVSYVIFACHTRRGGLINRFLSWTMWVPLSRVTFAAYLAHPVMMVVYVYTRMQLVYLADLALHDLGSIPFSLLYMFLGHWVFTYVLAFILTAAVEMPFRQIEKVIIRSRSPCCRKS